MAPARARAWGGIARAHVEASGGVRPRPGHERNGCRQSMRLARTETVAVLLRPGGTTGVMFRLYTLRLHVPTRQDCASCACLAEPQDPGRRNHSPRTSPAGPGGTNGRTLLWAPGPRRGKKKKRWAGSEGAFRALLPNKPTRETLYNVLKTYVFSKTLSYILLDYEPI